MHRVEKTLFSGSIRNAKEILSISFAYTFQNSMWGRTLIVPPCSSLWGHSFVLKWWVHCSISLVAISMYGALLAQYSRHERNGQVLSKDQLRRVLVPFFFSCTKRQKTKRILHFKYSVQKLFRCLKNCFWKCTNDAICFLLRKEFPSFSVIFKNLWYHFYFKELWKCVD